MGIDKEIEVLKKSQIEIKLEIKNKTNQLKISMESLLKGLNPIQGKIAGFVDKIEEFNHSIKETDEGVSLDWNMFYINRPNLQIMV